MTASPALTTLLTTLPTSERTLRRVLAADALVGLLASVSLLAGTELYGRLTELSAPVLRGVGLALLVYVVALAWAARRTRCPGGQCARSWSPTGRGSWRARSCSRPSRRPRPGSSP